MADPAVRYRFGEFTLAPARRTLARGGVEVPEGGMATPRGRARLHAALAAGAAAGLSSLALALTGHHLGAMSLDFTAKSFHGSQVSLDPLARLLGEAHAGALTRGVLSSFERLAFGCGLVLGLTRRPKRLP